MSQSAGRCTQQKDVAFATLYLQRTTQELSEDLDKIRNANDFKAESIPFLVHALQQGTSQFPPEEQGRIISAKASTGQSA